MAVKIVRITEQTTRRIKNMAADVGQDELFEVFEKRLIIEHREAVGIMNARAERLTDAPGIKLTFELPQRVLPAPVFVDKQFGTGIVAGLHHAFGFAQADSHRLLADDIQPTFGSQMNKRAVSFHTGDDVDKVQFFIFEQLHRVIIHTRHPKALGERLSFGPYAVTNGYAVRPASFPPASELKLRPESGSQNGEFQFWHKTLPRR